CTLPLSLHDALPILWPKARRMESASNSAWVGCSCWPSPALITEQPTFWDSRLAAPDEAWRTTSRSGCMAFSVTAVSIRVSPLARSEEHTSELQSRGH